MTDQPMAPYTGQEAVRRSLDMKTNHSGYCLRFVRLAFGIPATPGFGSAKDAWVKAVAKRPGDMSPPPGVPVYWDILSGRNEPWDHVAFSLGGGLCRSTSINGTDPGNVSIAALTTRWGMTYRGWSLDLNGYTVYVPPAGTGSDGWDPGRVADIQRALKTMGIDPGPADGVYGDRTRAAVRVYQGEHGLVRDGDWGWVTEGKYQWVRELQRRLNLWKATSPKLKVDGRAGGQTRRAVRQVKSRNGLADNDVIDAALLRLIGM